MAHGEKLTITPFRNAPYINQIILHIGKLFKQGHVCVFIPSRVMEKLTHIEDHRGSILYNRAEKIQED